MIKTEKPLGIKAYGSIAHLPGSRMGPADHHCHDGQRAIATEKARDRHDVIIVQEKLDGSCVAVAKIGGEIIALGRSGYTAASSPYEQHRKFAAWVGENRNRFDSVLLDGERIVGEWLIQAHGTRYRIAHDPFVSFDIMIGPIRMCYEEFKNRVAPGGFQTPFLISSGGPVSIQAATETMGEFGKHGALDPVEGCVWRVERKGKVDFLVKYVRPDKMDGKYLESQTGKGPIWNEVLTHD